MKHLRNDIARILAIGLRLLTLALCFTCASPSLAVPTNLVIDGYAGPRVPWKLRRMTLKADNKAIGDLLRQLAASNQLSIQVDERIRGNVSATFSLEPQQILDLLSRSYGFFWFYDGSSIIVSPSHDVKVEMVRLTPDALSHLSSTLSRLGIYDPRYPIRVDEANQLVVLNGPSRYVEMLANVSRALQDSSQQKAPTEVLVYPLKYAWADDRTMSIGNESIVIPGIANVLRGIYHPGTEQTSSSTVTSATKPRQRGSVFGGGALEGRRYGFYNKNDPAEQNTTSVRETVNSVLRNATTPGGAEVLPVITADVRRNAVIVRDRAERLPKHRQLIQELDTRSTLVEIEAKIVDVRTEALESLGLDWRAAGRRFDAQSGGGGNDNLRFSSSLGSNPIDVTAPLGGRFTVVAGNAANFLVSRIRALETQGKARTVGTPRVTTLDNVQSIMSSKEVFYVKVPGTYSSDLFEVSAGVSLKVLPFVISDEGVRSVRLAVNITDGKVDTTTKVEGLPLTTQSEINAEAIVREGASLLIAGYVREEESSTKSGVPVLSSLPGVGALFRHTSTNSVRQERFFLLTPRIITP
jgi:type III secretion protein C